DDPVGALFEQGTGQAAGPGPDLDNAHPIERRSGARDAPRHIEVEDEILAKALLRRDPVPGNDLAQRRKGPGIGNDKIGNHPRWRRPAISAASRKAAIRLSGRAIPWPAMSKAV